MASEHKWCDMESVNWENALESDDIAMSDNLLEFVKDDDFVKTLNQQEIIPQDILNEIINEFDFSDEALNMHPTSTGQILTQPLPHHDSYVEHVMTNSYFDVKTADDPLLSAANTSINYSNLVTHATTMDHGVISQTHASQLQSMNPPTTQIYCTTTTAASGLVNSIEQGSINSSARIPTTLVYHIANSNNCTSTPSMDGQIQQTAHILNHVSPIQMVALTTGNNISARPQQKYRKILEKNPPHTIQLQTSSPVLNGSQIVTIRNQEIIDGNNGGNHINPILINPTVMYTTAATTSGTETKNGTQNIHVIDGTTILATSVPTIMVDQENNSKIQINRISPPKVKEVKRSTHNAIERRYRTSINDKIVELKNILVGAAGKLNKSGILKRSIDKIYALEDENHDLREENARLRELLNNPNTIGENSTLKDLLLQKTIHQKKRYTHSSMDYANETNRNTPPPTSDESNPSLSPNRSDSGSMPSSPLADEEITTEIYTRTEKTEPPYKRTRRSTAKAAENRTRRGTSTHSKLALCAFMLAIITINPLANLLRASGVSSKYEENHEFATTARRTILSENFTDNFFSTMWQFISESAVVCTVNAIILIICMIKLLVYGDPIMSSESVAAEEYVKQKQTAEKEFSAGNGEMAFLAHEKCLGMFGVCLPQTWFDLITMTLWQFLRSCLHRIGIGTWLSRKCGGLFCAMEIRTDALKSARELALILNRLNQIHLTQKMKSGYGMFLSMFSVNMAEVAVDIPALDMIDIYLTAALRCRRNYPYGLSLVCSRYYLYKAKSKYSAVCNQKLPAKYNWIFGNSYGYKYICRFSFEKDTVLETDSIFSVSANPLEPLSVVYRHYSEHLLKCALQCLIGTGSEAKTDIKTTQSADPTAISDVLNYVELLRENCDDPLTLWWANIFSVDALWLLGEDRVAEKMTEICEKLPKELDRINDALPKAVIAAFSAKKLLMFKEVRDISEIIRRCNAASKLLEASICEPTGNNMILLVQLLLCDWLLESRTTCWELEQRPSYNEDENDGLSWYSPVSSHLLEKFQNDVNSLYCVIDRIPIIKSRIYLYEAIARLMAGAAPVQTQQLLDRSLHEQHRRHTRSTFSCVGGNSNNNGSSTACSASVNTERVEKIARPKRNGSPVHDGIIEGERERASAIYVACKYLPTQLLCSPGERTGMLAEAAKTLKKVGNQKKLQDCYQLMKSFDTKTVASN